MKKTALLGVLTLTLSLALTLPVLARQGDETIGAYYAGIELLIDGAAYTPRDVTGAVVEPFASNGTTYVPLRAVSEAFALKVDWEPETSTVRITTQPGAVPVPSVPAEKDELPTGLYVHPTLGFGLTLPQGWAGLYRTEETADGVTFYNSKNADAGWGGMLFGVTADRRQFGLPHVQELGTAFGRPLCAVEASGVRYDFTDAARMEEYLAMEREVGAILQTFDPDPLQGVGPGWRSITVQYSDIKIVIDGEAFTPRDVSGAAVEPFAYQGTTYVPIRAISEAYGRQVEWDADRLAVVITTPEQSEEPTGGETGAETDAEPAEEAPEEPAEGRA